MTQWVEDSESGRDRGPVAMARAWLEVLLRPRRFFQTGVSPGDQAPGLTFVMVVVAIEESSRYVLVADAVPAVAGDSVSSAVVALTVSVLLIAPAILHLLSAAQTGILIPFAPERGGVSETVQVLAYATAPCVFAGIPIPALRIACAAYGATLYLYGISIVHDVSLPKATALSVIPAIITFGYGFRGFLAIQTLLGV